MIDITDVDLIKFVKKVYELSVPQGLGLLHYQEGGLTDEEAKRCIVQDAVFAVLMDYVKGRSCKMNIFKKEGKLFIQDKWYDHTNEQLKRLLIHSLPDITFPSIENNKHNTACNCIDCRIKRGEKK